MEVSFPKSIMWEFMNEELFQKTVSHSTCTTTNTRFKYKPFSFQHSVAWWARIPQAAVLVVWYSDSILNTKLCRKKVTILLQALKWDNFVLHRWKMWGMWKKLKRHSLVCERFRCFIRSSFPNLFDILCLFISRQNQDICTDFCHVQPFHHPPHFPRNNTTENTSLGIKKASGSTTNTARHHAYHFHSNQHQVIQR